MAGRFPIRWAWLAVACAIALAARPGSDVRAQEIIRLSTRKPNNSQVIRLAADQADESTEGGQRLIRLLGAVYIDQGGLTRIRADRALVRLSAQSAESGYRVDVYAEGHVAIENGPPQTGSRALVELSSTAEPQFITEPKKQPLSGDPFVERARDAWRQNPTIVLASATEPPLPVPGSPGAVLPDLPPIPPTAVNPTPNLFERRAEPPPPRVIRIAPRTGKRFEMESVQGQNAILVTGGIILNISNVDRFGILDVEADSLVIWTHGDSQQFLQKLQSGQGESTRESEFFLSGNVIMRIGQGSEERIVRADQLYYDVSRNLAVGISAEVEFRDRRFPEALHFKADEVFQLGPDDFKAIRAEVFASRLPSDPGLKLVLGKARISRRQIPRTNVLGIRFIDRETGEPEDTTELYFQGENVQLRLADFPIFYNAFVQGTLSNPGGPIRGVTFGRDRILGYRIGAELDVFNLLGINPAPGWRWSARVDEFTKRGPGLGTTGEYRGRDLFGFTGDYAGLIKLYGQYDKGVDVLGGPRTGESHPEWRGRVFWRHFQSVSNGWQLMTQVSLLSDKNYLEQYYKPEFDLEANQETFAYLNKREDFWGASILVEPNLRTWVTETQWLPRIDGRVVGFSPLDLLTYNARLSLGYARSHPTEVPPPALLPTEAAVNLGRFDLWQELSVPVLIGPVKVVPFGRVDVAAYTNDLAGNPRGRIYGGGGVRAALPFAGLFTGAQSDLFNVQGIYHKGVFGVTYFAATTNISHAELPQLDRLNDDATDQALRDITPLQPGLNPANGVELATSPKFNPQLYAIRRLVDNRADTLDTIQVFQLDLRQRWQTKRGFPGMQHTVDWLTLDLSASLYPTPNRDNFGSVVGFIEYDLIWNVGDRTSVVSNGWFDPFDVGARYFVIGMNLNRPDRTLFSVSYRHADPIDSRLLAASAGYVFSPKYAMTASTGYDFGSNQGLWHSLNFIRSGTDLQLSFGINFNPITNNFGFNISVLPLLVANQRPSGANAGNLMGGRIY